MTDTQWSILVFAMMALGGWVGFMWGHIAGYQRGRRTNRWPAEIAKLRDLLEHALSSLAEGLETEGKMESDASRCCSSALLGPLMRPSLSDIARLNFTGLKGNEMISGFRVVRLPHKPPA